MDIIRELGALAFASRLKRLSERLQKDATRLYRLLSVDFEARWFAVAYLLREAGSMPVTEIASALNLTHPAINQITSEMERAGIVSSKRDRADERRRLITLTRKGESALVTLEPVWTEIEAATGEIISASQTDVLRALDRMEDAVLAKGVFERSLRRLKPLVRQEVEVVEYRPKYKKYFKSLNEEWLSEYFTVEPEDMKILNDPNRTIIRKGGCVLFVLLGNEVIATVALIKRGENTFELAKMAVKQSFRNLGIGRMLCDTAIDKAGSLGADRVELLTSPKLVHAIRLYRKCGFREIPLPDGKQPYGRQSIAMAIKL